MRNRGSQRARWDKVGVRAQAGVEDGARSGMGQRGVVTNVHKTITKERLPVIAEENPQRQNDVLSRKLRGKEPTSIQTLAPEKVAFLRVGVVRPGDGELSEEAVHSETWDSGWLHPRRR